MTELAELIANAEDDIKNWKTEKAEVKKQVTAQKKVVAKEEKAKAKPKAKGKAKAKAKVTLTEAEIKMLPLTEQMKIQAAEAEAKYKTDAKAYKEEVRKREDERFNLRKKGEEAEILEDDKKWLYARNEFRMFKKKVREGNRSIDALAETPEGLKMLQTWNALNADKKLNAVTRESKMIIWFKNRADGVNQAEVEAFVPREEAEQDALMLELMRNPETVLNRNC